MIKVTQAEFVRSARKKDQFPVDRRAEFAFVGKSNVGKSSLMNALMMRKGLVKVSSTPGKTRDVNFFLVNQSFYLTDLPGYGFAQVSGNERKRWQHLIEDYLVDRDPLKGICFLIDSRHAPTQLDLQTYEWLQYLKVNMVVLATKCDKLKKNELLQQGKLVRETFNMEPEQPLIFFSAPKRTGRGELLKWIERRLKD